jgi:chorismate--pyruvate lyase
MSVRTSRRWRASLTRAPDNVDSRSWLCDRGSLTARLQAKGTFSLRVLRQTLALPSADEFAVGGLAAHVRVCVREVALYCDGRAAVFAHTVLPVAPRGPLTRWLRRLGARSLGSLLFAHHGFARGPMRYTRIDRRHPLFAAAVAVLGDQQRALWARRSCFVFGRQRVLVTEIFAADLGD